MKRKLSEEAEVGEGFLGSLPGESSRMRPAGLGAGWDTAPASVLLGKQLVSGRLSPSQVLQVEPVTSQDTMPRSRRSARRQARGLSWTNHTSTESLASMSPRALDSVESVCEAWMLRYNDRC